MIKLHYVGPKPAVSHTGVTFDNKKDDKYRYLQFAVQLLKALDHDYAYGRPYAYEPDNRRYDDDEILDIIRHYRPDAENEAQEWARKKTEELDAEIAAARSATPLNELERETLVKNLRLMHAYRLQRTINKSLYYAAAAALADVIAKEHIQYIKAAFRIEHFHVLHTIEGMLRTLKKPFGTKMAIYEESGKLTVRLDITSR